MKKEIKEHLAVSLFLKHAATLTLPTPIVFGAPADAISEIAQTLSNALFVTDSVVEVAEAKRAGISISLLDPLSPTPTQKALSIVVFIPKSKALINSTLEMAARWVRLGTPFILVGEKAAGIESAKFAYERYVGVVDEKIVGNHSALYKGIVSVEHETKDAQTIFIETPVTAEGATVKTAALPGVFNHGALDDGTKLLLANIPFTSANILDMACGSGIIGALYKIKNPTATVDFADASIYATLSATETLKRNNLVGNVFLSDAFETIPKKEYDLIIVNPPFHTGIATDYSFIEKFTQNANAYLARGGEVYTVANKFLKYKPLLEERVGPTETIFEDRRYSVYKTIKRTGFVRPIRNERRSRR